MIISQNIDIPANNTNEGIDGMKIAVYVQLDDVTFFGKLMSLIDNIHHRFTLFISTSSADDQKKIRKQVKKLHKDSIVRHDASHKGLFGQMIRDHEIISQYDLLLFLHTNCLDRLAGNLNWFDDNYNGLIGSSSIIDTILGELTNNPQCGLIFSETRCLKEWANIRISDDFSLPDILGIDNDMDGRYFIDYPVNGMFWCRTGSVLPSLAQLLGRNNVEIEQFDSEDTTRNLINRCLTMIVKSNGFDYRVFDFSKKTYIINDSNKNLDEYDVRMNDILKNINSSDIISFDFYDTLFCRMCSRPEDVFWYIGQCLKIEFGVETDYIKLRKDAENRARAHYCGADVSIDQIYHIMGLEKMLEQDQVECAKKIEYDVERKILIPRSDVLFLAAYSKIVGKKVIISSDTYMPSAFFKQVLEEHGLDYWFDEIRTSNEINMRKDNGSYWSYVKNNESGLLHIGDNPESDNHLPTLMGIKTYSVLNPLPIALLKKLPVPIEILSNNYSDYNGGILLGPGIAKICSKALQPEITNPYTVDDLKMLGYTIIAPTLFSFISWIKQMSRQNNYDKIIFMSREGYYLKKLYDLYVRDKDSDAPKSDYMYISRTFAIGASLYSDFSAERIVDAGSYSDGTVRNLISYRCGIDLDYDIAPTILNMEISLPNDREKTINAINELKSNIAEASSSIRSNMVDYCNSLGLLNSSEKVVLVDIGYSCTMQAAMQTAIGAGVDGLYLSLTKASKRVELMGGTAASFLNGEELPEREIMSWYSVLLESFLTAPHGHVKKVIREDNKHVPVFEDQADITHMKKNDLIFKGVINYFDKMIATYGPEISDIEWDPKSLKDLFDFIINRPNISKYISDNVFIEQKFNGNSASVLHLHMQQ